MEALTLWLVRHLLLRLGRRAVTHDDPEQFSRVFAALSHLDGDEPEGEAS